MTRQDIAEMINSMGKPLTKDQLFTIGIAHKSIANKQQKDWDWLANITDSGMQGSAYRSMVNNRLRRELKENGGKIFTDKEYKLGIAETKNRDYLNAIRRSNRDEARIAVLQDNIIAAAKELAKTPLGNFKLNIKKGCTNEAIALFSDLHMGAECDNFANTYNSKVACKRVEKYANEIIRLCKLNNVRKLNVLNLADNIHGLIHIPLRLESELDVAEQIVKACEVISKFLNVLENNIEEVTYRSVVGNHCRMSADKNQNIAKESFGKIIDFYLEERLKKSKVKFIHDNLDDTLGKFKLENGKVVMFSHGDMDSIKGALQACVGAQREWCDIMLMAHYHNSSLHQCEGFKVIVNGSFVGVEQFALSKRLYNRAEQKLLIFSGDSMLNIDVDLQ